MIQTPVIVTFANQKGGVGKTTLCVTFANYLVTMGVRVVVVDCDIHNRSRSDLVNAIVRAFFTTYLGKLAKYRREKKSLFVNFKEEYDGKD